MSPAKWITPGRRANPEEMMGMKDVRGRAKREREYLDSIHVRSCAHCGRMFSTRMADKLAYCCQLAAFRGSIALLKYREILGQFRTSDYTCN